jgi:tetratricopeptide (TPR) repeat protein
MFWRAAAARSHEPNLAAYEAFLKGRQQFFKYSPEAFVRAEEYFKQAITLDPQWANPCSALGYQHFLLGFFGLRAMSEMAPLARAEALKALELLPSDPMAHALLGVIAGSHDYDWKEAEEQFKLAMASESPPPEVHLWYAQSYLSPLGRFDEAIRECAKAIAQDPLNVLWRSRKAVMLIGAEKYEVAIVEARRALELDNRSHLPHLVFALSYFCQGKLAEALESAEERVRLAPWDPMGVGLLAGLLAQAGEKDRAEELLATIAGTSPMATTVYHLVCSEIDAAIKCFERDIKLRHPGAPAFAGGFFKPLRAHPRWPKLAKMMNLPETNRT